MGNCSSRFLLWVVLLGLLALAQSVWAQVRDVPLRLGIMPFNSALALIKTHQPLRQHLEARLGRKVEIYTSADYYTFVNELLAGQFDLAIAGPHFGRMASERGWQPLVRYKIDLQPVFVVAQHSPIQSLKELKGRRIGLSSRLSISSIGGAKWLEDQGLQLGSDYQLFERVTHGAAVAAVAVGELDAAITTYTPLKQVPADVQARVRVLPLDIRVPHLMTLAHQRLGAAQIQAVRAALLAFPDTAEGRAFFSSTGYEGYQPVSAEDIRRLKPYVDLTLRMMKGAQ